MPDAGPAARFFRHLLSLLPLESQGPTDAVVRQRRVLRELSPAFSRYYMEVVPYRGPRT